MSTTTLTKRRVLFVDDEPAFLEMLGEAMTSYSAGTWEVLLASNSSKALNLLQKGGVHLVVVDIHMPVVDGIQFLKLLQRKYPNLPRAVLTGDASEEHREACAANGVEYVLEKPRCPEGLEIVYATLDELAKWQPQTGFQGVLRQVGLQDVLQMECLARSTVILEITANGETGQIFIERGSIIHSQVPPLRGEEAFNRLLGFSGGQFNLKAFKEPPERSITGSWEFLLMEAARMRDEELSATPPPTESEPEPQPLEEPPTEELRETGIYEPPVEFEAAQRSEFVENRDPASMPAAEEIGHEDESVNFQDLEHAPEAHEPVPLPETTPPEPPHVEEFLIIGQRGEVAHCWQCMAPSERVQFIEQVKQKARQACQGLPVGAFERLELESLEARLIIRVEEENSYLLRANRERPGVQLAPVAA